MTQKIAVIGSGIAGMSAAWLLNEAGYDIHVFEADDRLGGHTNSVSGDDHADVDTGFIVLNEATYPNLLGLFEHLGVEIVESDMSFAVTAPHLEYSSNALFAQKSNLLKPRYWRMVFDILRFYRNAKRDLQAGDTRTLAAYLQDNNYSQAFIQDHILPMGAAIWSMGVEETGGFPLHSFVKFFDNHGLMKITNRPQWYTVLGTSRQYRDKITAPYRDKIRLNTPVQRIERGDNGVHIEGERFDQIVFACHSDQALAILGNSATDSEKAILGAIPYTPNTAYLHRDASLMPKRKNAWASWNVLCDPTQHADRPVTLTYWMNKLQSFIDDKDLFVTLNPEQEPKSVLRKIDYAHPCYTKAMVNAQSRIHEIEGQNNTWFCGAWCGYGFHEDGIASGLVVAEAISGYKRPWPVAQEKSNASINMKGASS